MRLLLVTLHGWNVHSRVPWCPPTWKSAVTDGANFVEGLHMSAELELAGL